eukprot:TRINITY_DN89_c0_g2_i1.p1 TRINITY_DN89_c0_g2~~TRINITY_DN89_c0_g2_i1.p1  ORF type:complete len:245 (+),score=46.16 TRINITY_DN89_c0_g2_i1:65-736(+)
MEQLVQSLRTAFETGIEGREQIVNEILEDYVQSGNTDWSNYKISCPLKYARNLVEINPHFEMIVLVWGEGQVSPIHDHNSSNCWFAVLEGTVQEAYYQYSEEAGVVYPDEQLGVRTYEQGSVSYIKDELALHKVGPAHGACCTLHIYNKPIDKCRIFCPTTGTVLEKVSGYYTISDSVREKLGDHSVSDIFDVLCTPKQETSNTLSFMEFLPLTFNERQKDPN